MKTIPELTICGQIDFSQISFQCRQSGSNFDEILSIWDKDSDYEDYTRKIFPDSKIKFVYFDDDLSDPTIEKIQACLKWGKEVASNDKVLIHCQAGLSRSPAIALGVLYLAHQDVAKSIKELLKIRPQARPNLHITQLIDQAFQLDDELVKAVKYTFYA